MKSNEGTSKLGLAARTYAQGSIESIIREYFPGICDSQFEMKSFSPSSLTKPGQTFFAKQGKVLKYLQTLLLFWGRFASRMWGYIEGAVVGLPPFAVLSFKQRLHPVTIP